MKTNQPDNRIHQSTYALLARSEEKERSLFETIVYSLLILSAVAVIWQFAHQPINPPPRTTPQTASAAQASVGAGS
jgi:cytoskeletal protein RodZ